MDETAIVTFEFDTWGTWRTFVNGIMVAWHRGYDPWDWGPSLMERVYRGLLDEEIVK